LGKYFFQLFSYLFIYLKKRYIYIYFLQNVTETSDVKKRKNDIEAEVAAKKRKVEVDNGDDNDICIISNDDISHDNSEQKKSTLRKRKLSDVLDCMIVCDDDDDD